ncbi:MAG: hypothetical protein ACI8ZX_001091, partial [Planctomycetota bacterium]
MKNEIKILESKFPLKRIKQFIPIFAFFIMANSFGQKILNLDNFDIKNAKDATPIVVKALKKAKKEGISKLVFPKGTYHFYSTFAPERYC